MGYLLQKIEPANEAGGVVGAAITDIPVPSSYTWGKKDISSPKAGRTTSMNMKKMLLGKARTLDLAWKARSYADIAKVFQAFDYEYLWLTYVDALTGTAQRKHFYTGDFSSTSFRATRGGIWEVASLQLIQARPDR